MAYDTLETAQARILELEDQLSDLETERNTLSEENESLKTRNDELGKLNQKYFNRLLAQEEPEKQEEEEPDIPSMEEFAKSLTF